MPTTTQILAFALDNWLIIGAALLLLMVVGLDRIVILAALAIGLYFVWPYIDAIPHWIIALAVLLTVFRVTIEWSFETDRRIYRRK